jgi:hypothetical protein
MKRQYAHGIMAELDGRWLSHGAYRDSVRGLTSSDPRLRQADPRGRLEKITYSDLGVRLSVLEGQRDGRFRRTTQFHDPEAVQAHFRSERSDGAAPGRKTVYVLEGLGPGFVGVLGEHFRLHPSVFVEQERVVIHDMSWQGENDGLPLPSMLRTRTHLALKYYEVMAFDRRPTSFRWVCGTTGRHIGVTRELKWEETRDEVDQFADVGIVARKCGVWSRRRPGGGWECKRPPLRRLYRAGRLTRDRSCAVRSAGEPDPRRRGLQRKL